MSQSVHLLYLWILLKSAICNSEHIFVSVNIHLYMSIYVKISLCLRICGYCCYFSLSFHMSTSLHIFVSANKAYGQAVIIWFSWSQDFHNNFAESFANWILALFKLFPRNVIVEAKFGEVHRIYEKMFLPTSRKVLPAFQTFCPVRVQVAHWQRDNSWLCFPQENRLVACAAPQCCARLCGTEPFINRTTHSTGTVVGQRRPILCMEGAEPAAWPWCSSTCKRTKSCWWAET